jgi:hypothetical protein
MFAASTEVGRSERLGRVASGLLRDFAARTAACDEIGDERDREWIQHPRDDLTYYSEVRWGSLCKVKVGRSWTLSHFWSGDRGARILARGDRSYIERYAQEVARFGPPGGPEYNGEEIVWAEGDGGTQHGTTIGGEFRVMPVGSERGLLLYSGNDFSIAIVDLGERGDLQCTAEERRLDRRLEPLRVRIGDEPVELHGLGARSVVGYLELVQGAYLVLLHLEDETFGLFWMHHQQRRCLRIYTLAELRRGDLECALDWAPRVELRARRDVDSPGEGASQTRADVESGPQREASRARPELEPSARPGVAGPVTSLLVGPCVEPDVAPAPRKLAAADLCAVLRLLDPKDVSTGDGSTMVAGIESALRVLVPRGLGSQLLSSKQLRVIFAERCGVHLVGGDRTFVRAMLAVAARTRLFVRVFRRWRPCLDELLVPDSELMRWIRERAPPVAVAPARTVEAVCDAGTAVAGSPPEVEPAPPVVSEENDVPPPSDGEEAYSPPSGGGPDISPDSSSTGRPREGRPRLTLRFGLPADQAASQFQGRPMKSRGPPRR